MTPSRRPSPLRRVLRSLFLALAAIVSFHAPPAHASWLAADPTYAGYRIPEHRWRRWNASLDGSASHYANDSEYSGRDRQRDLRGRVGTSGTWGYDSDPLFHQWGFAVTADGRRERETSAFSQPTYSGKGERSEESLAQRLSWSGSIRWYPWQAPIGWSGSMSHVLDMTQYFDREEERISDPPFENLSDGSSARGRREYNGVASLSVGVGRVRDATPVFEAQVLEDRLLRTGSLTRALTHEGRQKLIALLSMEFGFGQAHQRPSKYLWREVERVLQEDAGLEPGALDAYDVLRSLEALSIGTFVPRWSGSFVGPVVSVRTRRERTTERSAYSFIRSDAGTPVFTSTSSISQTNNRRYDDVFSGVLAEFHRPLGPRLQLDASGDLMFSEAGELLVGHSRAHFAYIVSDRWLATVRAQHFFSSPGSGLDRRPRDWTLEMGAELAYFLEDSWALRLSATESQYKSNNYLARNGVVQLGITYVISGFFEAPGLVEAMRPAPPNR